MTPYYDLFIGIKGIVVTSAWTILPFIFIAKLLQLGLVFEGTSRYFDAIKGCLTSVLFILLYDYFFGDFLSLINNYIVTYEVGSHEISLLNAIWGNILSFAFWLSIIAAFVNAINSIYIIVLTLFLVAFMPAAYFLASIFDFQGLWVFAQKIIMGVLVWCVMMHLLKGWDNSVSYSTDTDISNQISTIFAGSLAPTLSLLSLYFGDTVGKVKSGIESKMNELNYEAQKASIAGGLADGSLGVNAEGRAVKYGLSLSPEADAIKESNDSQIARQITSNNYESKGEALMHKDEPKTAGALKDVSLKQMDEANKMLASNQAESFSDAIQHINNPNLKKAINSGKKLKDSGSAQSIKDNGFTSLSEAEMNQTQPQTFKALNQNRENEKIESDFNTANTISVNGLESVSDAKLFTESPETFDALKSIKSKNLNKQDFSMKELIDKKEIQSVGGYYVYRDYPETHKTLKAKSRKHENEKTG